MSNKAKIASICIMVLVFLYGTAVCAYPYIRGYLVDREMAQIAEAFLSYVETTSAVSKEPTMEFGSQTGPEKTTPRLYQSLWEDMTAYNEAIYGEGQSGLSDQSAYQNPSFLLADYGLESEVFGVLSIPAIELEMPLYLGAAYQHMAEGAAVLSQTSVPIGGVNTNSVIAGHRGWGGASYFRYLDKLTVGDTVIVTNLWETLTYEVVETQIIQPNDVDAILIRPNRELLTLLTCHPYASGGKQRLLVFCERIYETEVP